MERNAWRIARDIALHTDNAPVLSDYIRTFATEREEEVRHYHFFIIFFQQDPANHDYMKASKR